MQPRSASVLPYPTRATAMPATLSANWPNFRWPAVTPRLDLPSRGTDFSECGFRDPSFQLFGDTMQHAAAASLFEHLETRVLFAGESDMVVRWNEITIDALRADRTLPGPGWSSRSMAMMSLAVFDAVNTLDGSNRPYLSNPQTYTARNTSMDAAVASAAYRVLVDIYPQQKPMLDAQLAASLAEVPDGPKETRGVQLGRITADAILRDRRHDGSDRVVDYTVNPDPGHWQPDPLNDGQIAWGTGWGKVTPFILHKDDQFQAPAPPAMNSAAYAASLNEVKSLGAKDSTTRTAEQTQIGVFWGYDRGGMG